MANGQEPGTDVRPKKQYVAGFLDQATSAIKLKLKHMAEANKRGFTINKLTNPFIGLLIKISNTKIVVKVPLDDICTQCYKENLFGDKTRRKKIEQAAAPYLKPLVHSDFYTSHPYIYPYIIPMSKLNTKIFYIETDWIDAELQLLLGMQVRKPEGSQDPRLKISDVSRWTCCAESLSLIACCNMAATKWLTSFEEKEEGVLMSVLRFVDDPEVITTKAMRMTEYVDEKGEKLQRFRLYRPNVTSEEGSVPENAEHSDDTDELLEELKETNQELQELEEEKEQFRKKVQTVLAQHEKYTNEATGQPLTSEDVEKLKALLHRVDNLPESVTTDSETSESSSDGDKTRPSSEEYYDASEATNGHTTNSTRNTSLSKNEVRNNSYQYQKQPHTTNGETCNKSMTDFASGQNVTPVQTGYDRFEGSTERGGVSKLVQTFENMAKTKQGHTYATRRGSTPSVAVVSPIPRKLNDSDVSNQSVNLSNQGANFSNQGANFSNQSANFSNQSANFSNQSANFSNQGANFSNQSANFSNQSANFSNQSANISNQSANLSNQSANISNQSANFSNQSANLGNQSANVSNQSANLSNQSVNLSNQSVNFSNQGANFSNQGANSSNQSVNFSNQSVNGETMDSSFSSEEDTKVTSWLKRCCSTPMAGRGRARGRVERTTPPGVERSSLGSSKSGGDVSAVLPFVRSPQDDQSFSNDSLVDANDVENTSQCSTNEFQIAGSTNERSDGGATGWGSWLGKKWPGKVKKQVMSFFGLKNEETPKVSTSDLTVAIVEELDPHNASFVQSAQASVYTSTCTEPPRAASAVDTTKSPAASGGLSAGSFSREIRHCLDGTVDVVYSEDKRDQLLDSVGDTQKRYRIEPDHPNIPQPTSKADISPEIRHCLDGTVDVVYSEDKRHHLLNGTGNTHRRYRIDPNPDKPPPSNAVDKTSRPPSTERSDSLRQKSCKSEKKRDQQKPYAFPPIRKIADFQNGGIVSTEPLSKGIAASLATKWPSVKDALLDDDTKTGTTGGVDLFYSLKPSKTKPNV
ncbi:hypothetical protein Bbelb_260630 [Branchiostoma belcheri]|nr:hypothetical protein Bbelb_260630 [Branchiostoma belcheri]